MSSVQHTKQPPIYLHILSSHQLHKQVTMEKSHLYILNIDFLSGRIGFSNICDVRNYACKPSQSV